MSSERSRWFWPGAAVGWGLIVVGIAFALAQPGSTRPPVLAAFVIGLLVIHDGIIAPMTCVIGARMRRTKTTPPTRGIIEGAVILSVIVALFSVPLIAGWGDLPDNPSLLPGNYGVGLLIILAITWATTALMLLRTRRSAKND